ncbi:MAG: HDIG domain-containing metalloprotein [Bacteroidota bacterium]
MKVPKFFQTYFTRKLKSSRYWGRVGLIMAIVLILGIIIPRRDASGYVYEVGEPWDGEALYAPFTFSIHKTNDSVEIEKLMVQQQTWRVYTRDTLAEADNRREVFAAIDRVYLQLKTYKNAVTSGDSLASDRIKNEQFLNSYEINPDDLRLPPPANLLSLAEKLLEDIHEQGYLGEVAKDTLGKFIALRVQAAEEILLPVNLLLAGDTLTAYLQRERLNVTSSTKQLITSIIPDEITANYIYDHGLTTREQERRKALISPVYDKIEAGTLLIDKGDLVDKQKEAILTSLEKERSGQFGKKNNLRVFLSQILIIFLIISILLAFLRVNHPRIYFNNIKLGLILTLLLLTVGLMTLATQLTDLALQVNEYLTPDLYLSYIFLAPACIAPLFVSNFFGHRTAFITNLVVALLGGVLVQYGLEYVFVQLIAGTVAVYSLRGMRKREVFFYTLGYMLIAYILAFISYNLLAKGSFENVNMSNLLLFGINVAITMIAYNLIYPLEKLFGVTSDLTYLELLDNNHPLLQELARKAPGTYQHSLQVANIAETTVNLVGGNSLLTHVGALYHDIGKMINPAYFIENMSGENLHDDLTCEESAEIIIGHVLEGVELAQKYGLPEEIIRFIETHHGTTRVEYFYRKYLKQNDCAPPEGEDLFRYKGPLPYSKETAVLMIADSIEAASRALKKPTPEELRQLVDNIIDYKIRDNQFENSNLTFKDLSTIRESIYKQLISINHARLEYPKEETAETTPPVSEQAG